MLNLTFSREKNRELSSLEARVGSIRRRLIDPLRRRRNSLVARGHPTASLRNQEYIAAMGGKKQKRRQANREWEASETDESYANGSSSHGMSNAVATRRDGERRDSNSNDQAMNQNDGGRSRQGQGRNSSKQKHKNTLGPWSHAVDEAVRGMNTAQQAINNLQENFTTHIEEIGMIDETRRRLNELEAECRGKDTEIEKRENAITILTDRDQKARTNVNHELAQIEREKKRLEQERVKLENRIAVATAEESHKLKTEFTTRTAGQDKLHQSRMQELEKEFAKKKEENNSRVATLETEKGKLLTTVKEQETTMKVQADELEKSREQYDELKRAKDSIKNDMLAREAELKLMREEFALNTKPMTYFTQKFAEVYSGIESISQKYFHGIEGKDLEKVHEELAAADPCFKNFPIDGSDDSHDLCTAHAQRIITDAICKGIWTPFYSDYTLRQPEFRGLLSEISEELDQSSTSGRTANFWAALTTRALLSLQAKSESRKSHHSITNVISEVSVLSPLVISSEAESLKKDLHALVTSAIEVWNDVQAGGLRVTIIPLLDRAYREEWRSHEFDPSPDPDLVSSTHTQVFTLFPRVMARAVAEPAGHGRDPPGSWPPPQEPDVTCIHPGKGLPEWSSLVGRGKAEQEERDDFVTKAIENAKQQHKTKREAGYGRRDSRGSSTSGPLSPSTQWKNGGAIKFSDK
ncbi:hypothetical protein BJ875DRAFT_492718 [Amylocarpus encephaloides]|uniref:Uncharacterized protein n=1 Tax=Amylocarpus encephaloides TaxID=45428 RepID=A0A9P7YR19_9HELO|nr:hypothetical protein BJ875DRAFT_492718 [Amylocarpus encephaloides]